MMAVFYDRKHGCEVTSAQLLGTNVVEHYASCGDADDKQRPALEDLWNSERVVGELAYKTPECPTHQNWDRHLMTATFAATAAGFAFPPRRRREARSSGF